MSEDLHATVFEEHRARLLGAAYRVLGSLQDSEDAVQETWIRWRRADLETVRDPGAYLVRAVTRNALNVARAQGRRREEYPGPWLPEPVSTGREPEEVAEIADEISLALLVVLESLSPLERAAFVLREVFSLPYPEIARSLDRSEAAVRQLVRRARAHVHEGAPRHPVEESVHRSLTEAFFDAVRGEVPIEQLASHLAPDVVLTTDAGGRAKAALHPIRGVEKVLRFAAGVMTDPQVEALSWQLHEVNGAPAVIGHEGERIDAVLWIAVEDGLITRIDMVRNPEKLGAVVLER